MAQQKDCPVFAPQQACSGNGVCDHVTGLCICADGWTSIGDFSTVPGMSCSINIPTMRALWAIEILCSIGLFVVTTKYFLSRYAVLPSLRGNNGNKKAMSWKDPLVIFPLNFWIESITGIILGILKVIDPEKYSIALDPFASLMFALFYITGVHAICAYMYVLIKFTEGYSRLMSTSAKEYIRKEGEVLKMCSILVAVLIIPCCAIPLIAIAYPGHDRETAAANLVSFAFIASFLIGGCVRYMGIIVREIQKHLDGNDSNENNNRVSNKNPDAKYRATMVGIKNKLGKARMVMGILGPSSIVTFSTLAAWELLSRNTSYLWPLQLLATDVQFIPIVLSMMNHSSDAEESSHDNSTDVRKSQKTPLAGTSSTRGAQVVAISSPSSSTPGSPKSFIVASPNIGSTNEERSKYYSDKVAPEEIEDIPA